MDRKLNITAIEDSIAWADKNANLSRLKRNVELIPPATDVVVLPEMFSTGFITDKELAAKLAERNTGSTIACLQEIADDKKVALVGSYLARTAGKLYNRAFIVEPGGDNSFYDKRHLFRMAGEDKVFQYGTAQSPIVRFRGWNIRALVCYDLRFPVWCRNTQTANYDLLIFVANWPKARQTSWTTLLQARAMENLCYVCGVNRCGTDNDGIDYASATSIIVDYKGQIIASRDENAENPQIISATLNPDKLRQSREKFPTWMDADSFSITI